MNPKHPTYKDELSDEYTLAWKAVIDKIDHIFVNKLALLRSKHTNLETVIPELLAGYRLAVEHKLIKSEIDLSLLDSLNKDIDLKSEVEPMFQTLDAVHAFCEGVCNTETANTILSAKNYIDNMLNTYTFNKGERDIIHFNGDSDFSFSFPELFVNAALMECLKLTFNRFKTSQQKKVEIYLSCEDTRNAIHFKVICPEIQTNYKHFFENSLNTTGETITPGINFCRLALLKVGGDIFYKATEGQELEFVIVMPILSK